MEALKTINEIREQIAAGNFTLPDLLSHYLKNIESKKHLNAFLEIWPDEAMQQAQHIQEKIRSGKAGKLAGLIMGIKDNICYKNHQVSASSHILEGFTSIYSSTVVERLLAEDAIILGRCNCDEFAMGASNENSAFGPVRNALDENRVSGGSSGGSAVAVQANLVHASLGSDTGGSIRQPAGFCGLYGLKPTYSLVSRWGLIAYASSFDIIGPITRSVEDSELILSVISGPDDHDATAHAKPFVSQAVPTEDMKRIAVIRECLESDGIDPEVKSAMENAMNQLREQGYTIELVDFPYLDHLIPVYYTLTTAEASSNLSRFAGMHYGYRSKDAVDLESTIRKSRSEGFGEEVKRRIMLGTFVLSSGYYDAYYTKAMKVRRLVYDKTKEILSNYDLILLPTTPSTAFPFGAKSDNPLAMYLADIFTVHANIAGIPALACPVGNDSQGMPISIQVMANHFEENKLFSFVKNSGIFR